MVGSKHKEISREIQGDYLIITFTDGHIHWELTSKCEQLHQH